MYGRMRRVGAEQTGLDQVSGGCRFRALGKVQHQRGLLRGQADLALAELYGATCRVELEPAELVAPWPAGSALDQPGREVGVDVGHGDVALDEVRARPELVSPADGGRVDLGRGEDDHGQTWMVLPDPRQQLEAGVFGLIEDQIEEDGGDALSRQKLHRLGRR